MKNSFFAMLSRMKYINRWGLMKNTRQENIAEHSFYVSVVAHTLAVIKNKKFGGNINAERAATLGLYHDISETITGDMPTPVKYYNDEIKETYKNIEKIANKKLINMIPSDIKDEYNPLFNKTKEDEYIWKIVKAADKITALIKCMEEESMGNKDFKSAKDNLKEFVEHMNMEEVDYFITAFLNSYSLTLDELQER